MRIEKALDHFSDYDWKKLFNSYWSDLDDKSRELLQYDSDDPYLFSLAKECNDLHRQWDLVRKEMREREVETEFFVEPALPIPKKYSPQHKPKPKSVGRCKICGDYDTCKLPQRKTLKGCSYWCSKEEKRIMAKQHAIIFEKIEKRTKLIERKSRDIPYFLRIRRYKNKETGKILSYNSWQDSLFEWSICHEIFKTRAEIISHIKSAKRERERFLYYPPGLLKYPHAKCPNCGLLIPSDFAKRQQKAGGKLDCLECERTFVWRKCYKEPTDYDWIQRGLFTERVCIAVDENTHQVCREIFPLDRHNWMRQGFYCPKHQRIHIEKEKYLRKNLRRKQKLLASLLK